MGRSAATILHEIMSHAIVEASRIRSSRTSRSPAGSKVVEVVVAPVVHHRVVIEISVAHSDHGIVGTTSVGRVHRRTYPVGRPKPGVAVRIAVGIHVEVSHLAIHLTSGIANRVAIRKITIVVVHVLWPHHRAHGVPVIGSAVWYAAHGRSTPVHVGLDPSIGRNVADELTSMRRTN